MTRALALVALFAATAAAEDGTFVGHYGTMITLPPSMPVTKTRFATDGMQYVRLLPRKGRGGAFIQIIPKATCPQQNIDTLKSGILSRGPKVDFTVEVGDGWRLVVQNRPPRYEVSIITDGPEYIYVVTAHKRAIARDLVKRIRQEPRADWERTVLERRREETGVRAFIPDMTQPSTYASPLGYRLPLLPDNMYVRFPDEHGETLYMFPKKHGALMTYDVLTNAAEYDYFGIVQLQATRYPKPAKPLRAYLETLRDESFERLRVRQADYEIAEGAAGTWTMNRANPTFLRYVMLRDERLIYQFTSADRRLGDLMAQRLRH